MVSTNSGIERTPIKRHDLNEKSVDSANIMISDASYMQPNDHVESSTWVPSRPDLLFNE